MNQPEQKPVTIQRDTTEMDYQAACDMIEVFLEHQNKPGGTSLLQDESYYEVSPSEFFVSLRETDSLPQATCRKSKHSAFSAFSAATTLYASPSYHARLQRRSNGCSACSIHPCTMVRALIHHL